MSKRKYKTKVNNNSEYEWIIGLTILAVLAWIYKFIEEHKVLTIIILIIATIVILYLWYLINKKTKEKYLRIQSVEEMSKLHRREFEKFIMYVLENQGFKSKVRSWVKDWWIDVEGYKNWRKYLIQCKKRWAWKITEPKLREFYWAIMSFDKEAKWIYVTTNELTRDAIIFAKNHDIEIWDKYNLERKIKWYTDPQESVEEIKTTLNSSNDTINNKIKDINIEIKIPNSDLEEKICHKCWWKLILRTAAKWENKWKQFYGCENFPKCRTVVNIE